MDLAKEIPNPIKSLGLVTYMAPHLINQWGLVTSILWEEIFNFVKDLTSAILEAWAAKELPMWFLGYLGT